MVEFTVTLEHTTESSHELLRGIEWKTEAAIRSTNLG